MSVQGVQDLNDWDSFLRGRGRLRFTYEEWLLNPVVSPSVCELLEIQRYLVNKYSLEVNSKGQKRQQLRQAQHLLRHERILSKLSSRRKQELKKSAKTCAYCLKEMSIEERVIDHIIPLSLSGENTERNVVVCCSQCNYRKGAMTYLNWVKKLPVELRTNAKRLYYERYKSISFVEY
jgi:5-methylcytosine-specific restriction endonuclease McrA